ncbi:MAG: hypothetical protein J5I47_04690 [Vicingus serpentipes]|nr:hypothetical protein [Vicingus serpentipes]
MAFDPCFCIMTTKPPSPPPCDCPECCLKACKAVLSCNDAIGPCGQTGAFDLTTLPHIQTGCTGPLRFALEKEDGFFPFVNITEAGILTWVTPGADFVDDFGEICYRIACATDCEDCVILESVGTIMIGVKNLCKGSTCEQSEECDPCSGNCVDISVDTEVSLSTEDVDTEIT